MHPGWSLSRVVFLFSAIALPMEACTICPRLTVHKEWVTVLCQRALAIREGVEHTKQIRFDGMLECVAHFLRREVGKV